MIVKPTLLASSLLRSIRARVRDSIRDIIPRWGFAGGALGTQASSYCGGGGNRLPSTRRSGDRKSDSPCGTRASSSNPSLHPLPGRRKGEAGRSRAGTRGTNCSVGAGTARRSRGVLCKQVEGRLQRLGRLPAPEDRLSSGLPKRPRSPAPQPSPQPRSSFPPPSSLQDLKTRMPEDSSRPQLSWEPATSSFPALKPIKTSLRSRGRGSQRGTEGWVFRRRLGEQSREERILPHAPPLGDLPDLTLSASLRLHSYLHSAKEEYFVGPERNSPPLLKAKKLRKSFLVSN